MAADISQLAFVCAGTAAVNTVWNVQAGKEPVSSLVTAGITFAILSFGAQIWRYDVMIALAYVMLLAALLKRGGPIINGFSQLATGKKVS